MSTKLRNPFKIRASEKIESDSNFLKLFSPLALETLVDKQENENLWNNILFIRSTPGGGKTSLLRVFEPKSLHLIYARRSQEYYRDLFNQLVRLDVFNENGPKIISTLISSTRNYELLEDLSFNDNQKTRFFNSLLNSRIIIACLKSIIEFKRLRFPDDLNRIIFDSSKTEIYLKEFKTTFNGEELYKWALENENKLYTVLDDFVPTTSNHIVGHDEPFAPAILNVNNIKINGEKICDRLLFMFDDMHKLSIKQRNYLIKYLIEKRDKTSVWISERIEALEASDRLNSSAGRDYNEIYIERFWQDRPGKFEKILVNIAEKRARLSTEDVGTFVDNLEDKIDEEKYNQKLAFSYQTTLVNIQNIVKYFPEKFDKWLNYLEEFEGSEFDKASLAAKVNIFINRSIGKSQLAFDFPLGIEELSEKLEQPMQEFVYYIISRQQEIPYYIGFNNLVKLSNNNIDQFLTFAAELFDSMLTAKILRDKIVLTPLTQEKKLKKITNTLWNEIQIRIPYGRMVMSFLENLSKFALNESLKQNAPIISGVTGFSISKSGQKQLFDDDQWTKSEYYNNLVKVISSCVAFNLLEPRDVIQGQKNKINRVYYLNRWICLHFGLPLSYGGWKLKSTEDLLKWIK